MSIIENDFQLLDPLDDWIEARQNLKQMQSEYTGYSPSYHLASWFEAEGRARKAFYEALDAYLNERISQHLEGSKKA